MAMPDLRKQSGLGFAGPPGSHREAWPPSGVQNPSLEVQVLPDPARGEAALLNLEHIESACAVSPKSTILVPSKSPAALGSHGPRVHLGELSAPKEQLRRVVYP